MSDEQIQEASGCAAAVVAVSHQLEAHDTGEVADFLDLEALLEGHGSYWAGCALYGHDPRFHLIALKADYKNSFNKCKLNFKSARARCGCGLVAGGLRVARREKGCQYQEGARDWGSGMTEQSWREDPATKAQLTRLRGDGLPVRKGMTKGEASDLIGTSESPDEHDLAVLKFFKVPRSEIPHQTAARQRIQSLFEDPENVKRWENRPATAEQKDMFKFFKREVPRGLTYRDAQRIIAEEFTDEDLLFEWDDLQDQEAEREDAFEDAYEQLDEIRKEEEYPLKKVPKKLFRQVAEEMEAAGSEIDAYDLEEGGFFDRVLELKPDLAKKPRQHTSRSSPRASRAAVSPKSKSSDLPRIALGLLVFLFLIGMFLDWIG